MNKYLATHAEPEIELLKNLPPFQYDHCVVIPAFKESSQYLYRLIFNDFLFPKKISHLLGIIVLNCPDNASRLAIDRTKANLMHIQNSGTILWHQNHISLFNMNPIPSNRPLHLLVVDRINTPIPNKQGVGLARKIGADLACYLHHQERLISPWIHSTDADAHLPKDYFQMDNFLNPSSNDTLHSVVNTTFNKSAVEKRDEPAAFIYPFSHKIKMSGEGAQLTTLYHLLYECHLFHYQLGLLYARSPYGFQTIGSTLSINIKHYVMVRGFPKRSAGEDFYILNKLVKVSHIVSLTNPSIKLDSRLSTRNPFGTGPAVVSMLADNELTSSNIFYNPHIFILLKKFISLFLNFSQSRHTRWEQIIKERVLDKLDSSLIIAAASAIQFEKALVHAYRQFKEDDEKSAVNIKLHLHIWFDGFRTLKWIHFLKNSGYGHTNIVNAYDEQIYPVCRTALGLDSLKHSNTTTTDNIERIQQWLTVIRQNLYKERREYRLTF